MAILKGVTPKDSGASAFIQMVKYVSNSEKTNNDYSSECEEFEAESFFRRYVYNQQERKRFYKQYVVSLEVEWNRNMKDKLIFGVKLEKVIHECKLYYMEKGFRVLGYVHFNTSHPHFHILVDTCNALNGKQLSESAHNLELFKIFISSKLMEHGLNEEILMDTFIISEEEMMQDDEFSDEYRVSEFDDSSNFYDDDFSEDEYWNSGTREHSFLPEMEDLYNGEPKILCTVVPKDEPKVLCTVVPKEEPKILCTVVPKEEPKELCTVVPKEEPKILCTVVSKDETREMCTIVSNYKSR